LTEEEPDEARMVKKFRRAAAGLEEQLPSDLRPPAILKKTCDYLFNDVIGNAPSLAKVHHFVWDRTRAVRNDFSIQQVRKSEELRIAVECYERIARFHIASLHQLALPQKPYSKYDWQQEREQLDRTLLSLMQYYDDCRGRITLPNEAEFRAYCVIFQLQDPIPDLEDRVQTWPRQILQDTRVQKALDVYMAACNVLDVQGPLKPRAPHLIARQDWQRFWSIVASKETSYLMACVAEIYFSLVRRTVLAALFRTSRANSSNPTEEWTIDLLCHVLAFDDGDQVYEYCQKFGFTFNEREDGQQHLDLSTVKGKALPEPNGGVPKQLKTNLVEDKRFGRTIPAVINGLAVRQAQDAGLVVDETEEDYGMDDVMDEARESGGGTTFGNQEDASAVDDGESLFIPETNGVAAKSTPFGGALAAATTTAPSPFSGFGGGSTFGKPSGSSDIPSLFTKPNAAVQSAQPGLFNGGGAKFDFTKPLASTTPPATTAAPLFSFTQSNNAEASNKAQQSEPTPGFSWNQSTKENQPTKDSSSVFSGLNVPAAKPTPSLFQPFSAPQTSAPILGQMTPSGQPPAAAPSLFPQQPQTSSVTPAVPLTAGLPSQSLELKAQQPQLNASPSPPPSATNNANHDTPLSPLGQGARRPSSSHDNRPKKPSPLSNSITATEETNATSQSAHSEAQQSIRPPAPADDLEANIARVADEFFHAPVAGVLDQYIRHHVSQAITEVKERLEREENNAKADDFRHIRLCVRYGRKWRSLFWQHRLAKSGRERRQRRQRRLQERGSAETEGASFIGHESISSRAGSVLRGGIEPFKPDVEMGSTFSKARAAEPQAHSGSKRPASSNALESIIGVGSKRPVSSHGLEGANGAPARGHKRMKSTSHVDDRGRITKPTVTSHPHADILKRSSFLAFSRDSTSPPTKNTTTSSYFRLKAMGLNRVDATINSEGRKRRMSASTHNTAQTSPPALRSPSLLSSTQDRSIGRTSMPPPASNLSRASQPKDEDEDEALFARLRAARENLSQSTSYYKEEVSRDGELQNSLGASQSSNEFESPSMLRARTEARLRASTTNGTSRAEVPAYRMRESRFVPRENYGRAIERAQQIRATRSRDPSRPESRTSDRIDGVYTAAASFSEALSKPSIRVSDDKPARTNGFGASFGSFAPLSQATAAPTPIYPSFGKQDPISFADHVTEMPMVNPFPDTLPTETLNDQEDQLAYTATSQSWQYPTPQEPMVQPPQSTSATKGQASQFPASPQFPVSQDLTIQPSLIDQALANSFGESHGHGHNHMFSLSNGLPRPETQQDSYLATQAVSLLSDDEDEETEQYNAAPYFQTNGNGDPAEASEELVDETTGDEEEEGLDQSYGHINPYAALARDDDDEAQDEEGEEEDLGQSYGHANPYAALAGGDEAQDEDEGWDSQIEGEEDYDEEEEHTVLNGHAEYDDEDEEGADGDIDDDETEDLETEDDDGGYDLEGDHHGGNVQTNVLWAREAASQPAASPGKNTLQVVGNTVEEAIELSD